jgi:hypothetical protein
MTNGKKSTKRAKPKATKVVRRQLRDVRTSVPTDHEDRLIGLTDPFSPQASEARYPDQGAGRTLTFQQRYSTPLSSDANGLLGFIVSAKPNYPFAYPASISGTQLTWGAAYSGNFSTNLLNTYGVEYRPTSVGIRVANTLSATNSSGYIVFAKAGAIELNSTTTMNPSNFTSWDMHPMTHGEEWHSALKPRSSNGYAMGSVAALGTTTVSENSWEYLYVYCSGLPASTSCIVLEVYLNYEYIAKEDSPIAMLAAKQPVLDINMQTAVNAVQSSHPTSHKGTRDKIQGFVKREAKKALLKHVLPFAAKKATQLLL